METGEPRVIRIALLGADHATAAIARAVADSRRFDLVGVCELESGRDPTLAQSLMAQLGRVRHFDVWEALLDPAQTDAVVVARSGDDDRRAEQLRKLIQTGVTVVTSHPVVDSMLVYYELDMIRRDTGSLIVPYLPDRLHPAVRALCELARHDGQSPLGKTEQVILQRRMSPPDKSAVQAQFARDVDVIRAIAGDITRLGAMAGAHEGGSFAGLGVQMSGPSGVVARWSVDPMPSEAGAQLCVVGAQGKAVVEMRGEGQPWSMTVTSAGKTESTCYDNWQPGAAVLERLEATLAGAPPTPDWVDAARAVELAETIERSLQKSRTIELYYEDYTEEGTFKGTMTSVGCGLLMLGLCLVGLVAIADHLGVPYAGAWPYLLIGVLGVFLLLQLLMLVFRSEKVRRPEAIGAEDDANRAT